MVTSKLVTCDRWSLITNTNTRYKESRNLDVCHCLPCVFIPPIFQDVSAVIVLSIYLSVIWLCSFTHISDVILFFTIDLGLLKSLCLWQKFFSVIYILKNYNKMKSAAFVSLSLETSQIAQDCYCMQVYVKNVCLDLKVEKHYT